MSNKINKICFIISPIGEKGSDTRCRSDQILNHIITPVVEDFGYNPIRADQISKPGLITQQIIHHLIDDSLVIADLSEQNPNVFYELAIRHVIKKPVIQIIQTGETIPFDVSGTRTILLDYPNWDSLLECKNELKGHILSLEDEPEDVVTPISVAIDQKFLHESKNPLEKSISEIFSMIQGLKNNIDEYYSDLSGDLYDLPVIIKEKEEKEKDPWLYK